MTVFCEWFNKALPQKVRLLGCKKNVFALGNVKDWPQSRWREMRFITCATVSPFKLTQKQSTECGVCKFTWRKNWILSCITWESQMNCQMLTWIYAMTHVVLCWNTFLYTTSHSKVLFADEHAIYCRTHNPTHVMLWAGMTANASPYEEMPQLRDRPPHSPDLTTPCNSLWGIMKGQVAAHRWDKDELRRDVAQAFTTTAAPQMLQCMLHSTYRSTRCTVALITQYV
jgi:hypothetical protein